MYEYIFFEWSLFRATLTTNSYLSGTAGPAAPTKPGAQRALASPAVRSTKTWPMGEEKIFEPANGGSGGGGGGGDDPGIRGDLVEMKPKKSQIEGPKQ